MYQTIIMVAKIFKMATPTAAAGSAEHLGINVEELITRFSALDYAVFGMLLALSLAIGVYFGLCKRHEMTDAAGYLLGGRNMGVLPAAMSLIASFMSAITLLGTPAEVYQYGTQYIVIGFSYLLVMPAAAYLYMPVFFDLQLISVYEGGMKAVLWTDTIQMIIMFGAMLAIIIKGSLDVGGFGSVWHAADEGERLEFLNFDPSPGVRHTVWTLVVGGYFTWVTIYGVNQAQVQRYLCVPTKRKAAHAIWINLLGLLFLLVVCSYAGLVIYAKYPHVRPAHLWLRVDLRPAVSAVCDGHDGRDSLACRDCLWPEYSAARSGEEFLPHNASTVSSGINSLAAIALEDFIIPNRKEPLSHERQALITQVLAVVFGILGFVLVFVAEQLGDILQAALSLYGMVGGPLLGLFTLGMFFPWANYKGAMSGVFSGLFVIFWIGVGFQVEKAFGRIHIPKLPTSIDGCPRYNSTEEDVLGLGTTPVTGLTTTVEPELEHAAGPYYMSYMWYSTVASTVVVVVGMLVSLATGAQDPRRLDPRLIIPLGDKFKFLPQRWRNFLNFDVGINYESPKAEDLDSAFAHLPTTPSTFPLVEVVKRPAVSVDLNGDTDNGCKYTALPGEHGI
ncbi:Sodium-coupled monocarboxylate transporter 2 [Amphibalanus amphitrite]|uniref:Sodium-coupled monocarboxylate transporter 2 n=1 Tax=Amphibalanus amphitrite TaxID=1232801 RepID=A0A6A4XAD4_AMPAM|nr:Sodium-coupled monocarboxylate transporter 2 [Amphibalanus amphitrite]